ncbi:MAG: Uma2 family endonuclease [Methylomonas sp.]|nr:Uma2 family endonuclease [Methylomonas sp.]PPD19970.1 MAG: restriction endonuclease [Methylomonas sp.]PPD26527.1 MAG: restriction endonuclease [Methylomonas sp.]PPD36934.1 MAG: restriction endonuclease [Methylomonas sp.]PPD38294.1 MAG: restriction endonuclease [Methylomonas sp.]
MAKITQLSQLDLTASYSYADYMTWQLSETVELIKGKISLMAPAPNVDHQRLSMYLSSQLFNYSRHKSCQVFAAPFDVRLYDRRKSLLANQEIFTVVQPDICVICDPDKLDEQGCNGAPDWIIEIVSKSSAKKDAQIKSALYAESGVQEYWLVFPYETLIQQFVLNAQGQYQLHCSFAANDLANSYLFPDLSIDLGELFPDH